MRDIQVSPIPYIWRHCELRNGMFGMGFMGSGGSLGESGYLITIPGAVITGGGPGVFNETTGASGVIATATTDLPDLGAGFKWGVVAGSDADISVASTATGQAATMNVSSARAIYSGDSANFTLRVENGTVGVDPGAQAIEFPFTATGTVAAPALLLDNLTATATAAYSLRKLRDAYTGSCIRIKRNSDAVETDIGFSATPDGNGDYWVDTAAIASHSPGGCTIAKWYDQTTNTRDATQTTQTYQPAYSATGWAGTKPAISFDGTDNRMNIPDHRASFTNDMGVVAVARGATASRVLFNTQQGSGDNSGAQAFAFDASGKIYWIADPTTGGRPQPTSTADFRNTNMSLIGNYDNTTGAVLYANGETVTVSPGSGALNFGTGTTYSWGLGFYAPSAGNFWNGTVEELIIFNTILGSTDRTTVRTSHTAAYGVP